MDRVTSEGKRGRLHVLVLGRVQGVAFRDFTQNHARALGLTGWVRSFPDGKTVEVMAEGSVESLKRLLEHVKQGPAAAQVFNIEPKWDQATGEFAGFHIRP